MPKYLAIIKGVDVECNNAIDHSVIIREYIGDNIEEFIKKILIEFGHMDIKDPSSYGPNIDAVTIYQYTDTVNIVGLADQYMRQYDMCNNNITDSNWLKVVFICL